MLDSIGCLILGLLVLVAGGEIMVKGAVGIALKFKVSTLVIGLTVVSFGTSAPELLVSLQAAAEGKPAIAIGNVIGSNVANIALVLGVTCIIFPILVKRSTLKVDWSFMMLSSLLLFAFMTDGLIAWYEGMTMFLLLIIYNFWSVRRSRKDKLESENFKNDESKPMYYYISLIVIGCIGLVFGSEWLLKGAIGIAAEFNVPDNVIGATIIAFGTSVPELATSAIAAYRKETDISIGNLIGSNIFNVLCILGITPMIKEIKFDTSILENEMTWMLLVSFLILPLSIRTLRIDRWKGILFTLIYIAFCYKIIF